MLSQFKRYFIVTLILFAISSNVPTFAAEWYEGGNLHMATLREWKNASQKNQLATCADFIGEAFLDSYFKLPFNSNREDSTQLKKYANQLLGAINIWANNNENDNQTVNEAALISMLQLGWIDESYLNFLAKKTGDKVNPPQSKTQPNIPPENESKITENSIPSKSRQKVTVAPKPKLMSKKAGKEWVKKNVKMRLHFPLEDMKFRLGDYEATTIGNIERYYFPRINITFFVIKSSQEFIGFSESKPLPKTRKE